MFGRFDEHCPACEKKLDVYSVFQSEDYRDEFNFNCPECEAKITCYVHAVPEFELFRYEKCANCHKEYATKDIIKGLCWRCRHKNKDKREEKSNV